MSKLTLVLLFSLVLLTVPATAGVVFDNFTIKSGTIDAWLINTGSVVSDSFILGSNAVVNGVDFGVWLNPGASVSQVDWSIGTVPFGSSFSGTAVVSDKLLFNNAYGFDIDLLTFVLPDLDLAGGQTYYLTLQNTVTSGGGPVYWDESDGANSVAAYVNALQITDTGAGCGNTGLGTNPCSESFDITTPEPSTWMLLGSGILAAFALRRRAVRR